MDNMEELVLAALKNKAPELLKDLKEGGELNEFVKDRAEEINSLTTSLAHQIAEKQGHGKTDDPLEKTGIMNSAIQAAREIVLAEQLEFPPDETSPQNQD